MCMCMRDMVYEGSHNGRWELDIYVSMDGWGLAG